VKIREKSEDIRKKILDGAKQLFQIYGYRAVTIDEIAVSLKMSKRTIYQQFDTKDELIMAVADSFIDQALQQTNVILAANLSFGESFVAFINAVQTIVQQISPPMLRDMQHMPEVWTRISARRQEVLQRYGAIMARGQRDGDLRQDIDIPFILSLLLHLVTAFATPQVMLEHNITPRDMITRIQSVLLCGILSDTGRQKLKGDRHETV
jgi:AcrR family transcriptional regulator